MNNDDTPEIQSHEALAETVVAGISPAEYARLREEAMTKAKSIRHEWRMRGRGILVCTSCEFSHRSYIDPSYVLVGIDDEGLPIFKKID